jgi:hypothetical protein
MVSAERLLVSVCFIMYYYHHLLVSHPAKSIKYTASQNENGFSSLTFTEKEKPMVGESINTPCNLAFQRTVMNSVK